MDPQEEYQELIKKFDKNELSWGIMLDGNHLSNISSMHKNVSLTHAPTGITVTSQAKNTQIENSIAALKELIEKLKEMQ